jgi:hypothetical protein
MSGMCACVLRVCDGPVWKRNEIGQNSIEQGMARGAWEWFSTMIRSLPVPVARRLFYFLQKKDSLLRLPKIGLSGGSPTHDPSNRDHDLAIAEDLHVYDQLCEIACWFPAAFRLVSIGQFQILYPPLLWELRKRMNDILSSIASSASSSTPSSSASSSSSTSSTVKKEKDDDVKQPNLVVGWNLDAIHDEREMMPHQKQALEAMIDRDRQGYRAHFLADRCGTGKTAQASWYLMSYLQTTFEQTPHRMPRYVFYIGPPGSLGEHAVPEELAKAHWPLHTWVPLQDKKRRTRPKPYHINFIKHDHVRLCIDEILQLLGEGDGVLFIDEAHECMGESQRSSSVLRVSHTAAKLVMITATPSIHTDLMEASPFVSQMVPYPVTRKNIWTASRSMITFAPPPRWTDVDILLKAPLTEAERVNYRRWMPPALGGTNPNATRSEMIQASQMIRDVCTRKMIEAADPGTVIWALDATHQKQLADSLRARWKAAASSNDDKSYMEDDIVVEMTPSRSVNLTAENEATQYPKCKAVVIPRRLNSSVNCQRFCRQMEMVMPDNFALRQQRRGRIGRDKGQRSNVLTFVTVVDDMGLLERLRHKHENSAEVNAILRALFANH